MSEINFEQIHINVYDEIACGKYNPCLAVNNKPEVLRDLVFDANTIKIVSVSAHENPYEFIENIDFLSYGYKNDNDYEFEIKHVCGGKQDVMLKPTRVYDLLEVIDIPQYISFKCSSYIDFMGDEFERIKIRAEKILENANDEKLIRMYACKHIQKAKKIFYEAKRQLREVQKSEYPEDVYIFFVLNLFVIRTILFYEKMFRPYLNITPDTEELLFHEVLKELSLRKLCALFPCGKTGYGEYIKRSFIGKATQPDADELQNIIVPEKTFVSEQSHTGTAGKNSHERIKVNGQINVFVDLFVQLLEEIEVQEGMFLETTRENLQAFLVANFKDKNDKAFSMFTIQTLLKPYRTDKHIKKGSPRRIDLSKRMKRK